VIGNADDFRFSTNEFAIRRGCEIFCRDTGQRGATLAGERADRLLHGQRKSDEFQRHIHSSSPGLIANSLHRIARPCVDRYRA